MAFSLRPPQIFSFSVFLVKVILTGARGRVISGLAVLSLTAVKQSVCSACLRFSHLWPAHFYLPLDGMIVNRAEQPAFKRMEQRIAILHRRPEQFMFDLL